MLDKLKNYVTWKHALTAAAIFVIGGFLPGCLDNWVSADPPPGAASRNIGGEPIPAKLKYNKSVRMYTAWKTQEEAFGEQWAQSIADAEDTILTWNLAIKDFTSPEALISFGLNPASGGVSAGLYALGLFTRRPGDKKKIEAANGSK